MKTPLVPALVLSTLASLTAPAHAGPQQGVSCSSGFSALISDGNRKLVCRKTRTFERSTMCLPLFTLVTPGTDVCRNGVTGATTKPGMSPVLALPGQPADNQYTLVVNATGRDKFVATAFEFAFPAGGPIYIGDSANGVVCPAGFDGDKAQNDRGIRCDKQDGSPRSADCDGIVGWEWKLDLAGAEDRCRHLVTGETGPTKPEGMTKAQHDFERSLNDVGWVLNKKTGARDTWQRKVYKFPIN